MTRTERANQFIDLADEQARATHPNGDELTLAVEARRLLATMLAIRDDEAQNTSAGYVRRPPGSAREPG